MKSKILKKFAANLKYLRNQKNWSQEKLANKCGLHRTYIGSVERGERNISLMNISRIATALSVKIDDLLK